MSETEKPGADAGAPATPTIADQGGANKAPSGVSGTLAEGGGQTLETPPDPKTAPDWRDGFAGDDKEFRKRLDRFTDPSALAKSYRALEQKLSSGEYKAVTPFPDKGTAEEQAAWRKEQGVPDKPEAYEAKLPNGMVPGEADKPGLERLAKHAHGKNWSKDQYNAVLEAYYAEMDAVTAQRDEADGQFRQTAEDTLRLDWAADFKTNKNAIHNLMTGPLGLPKEDRAALLSGRTADGRLIGDNPAILKWLATLSRELNPAATVLPAGNVTAVGVEEAIKQIEGVMRTDRRAYDKDPAMQQKLRDLYDAREKMKSRAA
jgi:hypothetical protein